MAGCIRPPNSPSPVSSTLRSRCAGCPLLSAAVGREVWIKRDDIGGVALAGNRVRTFDLVLGGAVRDGADLLITTGAGQSNAARAGAAGAAILGMDST